MGDQLGLCRNLLAAAMEAFSCRRVFTNTLRPPGSLTMTEKQRRELEAARKAREEAIKAQLKKNAEIRAQSMGRKS